VGRRRYQDKAQAPTAARAYGETYLGRLQRMDNGSSMPLTGDSLRDWKPRGILVAHLHEHHGPVNQLKATRDNLFFASCSDDGTVKIWDCQRLTNQKNVTNRSRLTYSSQGTLRLSLPPPFACVACVVSSC